MPFPKDILILDFETTGYKPATTDPIEIGAVLLDKETLGEKDSFSSFIYSDLKNVDPDLIKRWDMPVEEMKTAPKINEVAQKFLDKFGTNIILSSWVQKLDMAMLDKLMLSIGRDIETFDYHYFDLWPVAYMYLVKNGYSGEFDSESMFAQFGQPKRTGRHSALHDCRLEAEVLRKLYGQ